MNFVFNEKYLSQIHALQLLINLGLEYMSPSKAFVARQGINLLEKQAPRLSANKNAACCRSC